MNVRVGALSGLGGSSSAKRRRNGYSGYAPRVTVKSRVVKSKGNRNRNYSRGECSLHMPKMSLGGMGRFCTRLVSMAVMAVLVLAVSVGLLAGYRWLTTVNYFALQHVSVTGCSRLSEEHIRDVAGLTPGVNVLSLSMDRMRTDLVREPWIDAVSVKRVLPGTILVDVKEKSPSYLVQYQGTLYYADEGGRIIDKVEPGQFVSLPQIEVEAGMEKHLPLLADLRHAVAEHQVPFDFGQIAWLRLSWGRGLEIRLLDPGILLCLGSKQWDRNLSRMNLVWTDLRRRGELGSVGQITAEGDKVWVEKRGNSGDAPQG
ncbi:Polypeptide-transport-associated domain protein FtsQ-type [Solidesulfovibrio fructosivorans JJ]]|uniref:Polypeptide-transport-associated domain protein FtsQ-type n=1 Tax=Solidesulfovibrio fructosivorans JJ] TaxID=596151 RepID=E1JTW6_SOLFR|nr:FtsQ-type POTRA domain-containing protein [Solidesulfovibrio fructosivorans]EFL52245.1 Polypeptide-transport-associated domain protein FtsQ-type [Solidesulfovibrio fructosivorans JJ]]